MAVIRERRDRTWEAPARTIVGLVALFWALGPSSCPAAELAEADTLFRLGRYDDCARMAALEILQGPRREGWHRLKIESELAVGNDNAALASLEDALRRLPFSLPLRMLARDVYRANGRDDEANASLDRIDEMIQAAPSRYDSAEGRVALGRFFLIRGADARKVLDQFFDVAIKQRPELIDAYFASAELALAKQDNALAASTLAKAPKAAAEDPRYHYLMALALSGDDRARSETELAAALKINPNHVDSLLLQADHRIDEERYELADKLLDQVAAINPVEPRAWAYRAVLAHLRNKPQEESAFRDVALKRWAKNPEVDSLIGRELARKYRFAEGAKAQRQALALDPDYRPAKAELCQDLLRLGEEAEGWKLAQEIFDRDPYDVVAFNLVALRDRLSGFRTLRDDGFLVRMDPREADLYGSRVLDLLRQARKTLTAKYGVAIDEPVIVEIFPRKNEFAVRTFGLPGAEGFLGVCFGRVITANSPASQGETPSNWEGVLWHEFCHAVTLGKSKNKMPRWLSEGISVYEESQQNKAWGGATTPRFRAMILGDDFVPLSRLSSAFLEAKDGAHLQFAYHESALAVAFLVQKSGLDALKGLLDDLGNGQTINDALPGRTGTTLVQLDAEFLAFARARADAIAPGATWDEPKIPEASDSALIEAWIKDQPRSVPGWKRLAARLVLEEKWPKAKEALATLRSLYPDDNGEGNADMLLALLARKTNDPALEREALERLASRDGDNTPAFLRLMALDEAASDWPRLAADAARMLAVNPLIPGPHRKLALAAEKLGRRDEALAAYRAVAMLDDTDPAEIHFRLAKLLKDAGKLDEARREVLKSLEDAPRFLEAHRLLLELAGPGQTHSR